MDNTFHYAFPAIRGVQAGREYYVSMCPLRLIPKIFLFDEEELTPELRSQRTLNKSRIPEMSRYITEHPNGYVFSALTASVDADLEFDPVSQENDRLGVLRIPMSGTFIINDGQHRRAAIEAALKMNPKLGDETIAVVFFSDIGLARSQQMFADLNRYAIRPSTSISLLYDHRDQSAELTRRLVLEAEPFRDLVEMERSTLSTRSRRLFTFSAIYQATNALLADTTDDLEAGLKTARAYWEEVAKQLPEWNQVRRGRLAASEVRQDLIHSHAVVLNALGRSGAALLREAPNDWKRRLKALSDIDWSRNSPTWAGRAVVGGRLSKATQNVVLTTNYIKKRLGLELSPEDQRIEDAHERGDYERST
ncbi:DNA sulfur modification protein DndB [Tropicimonas marinistellae]|uniref:DNA sulfur modification protein DndB n=1 Tax=Tropicimonas marinistellae TaxID=1739787 RepID=UPI000834C638|nr:DNA sulfur modification protein DndB [Tropicimonas marinistellae]